MNNLSFRTRIILGFTVVLLIIVGIGGLTFHYLRQIDGETVELKNNSLPGLWTITQIQTTSLKEEQLVDHLILIPGQQNESAILESISARSEDTGKLLKSYETTLLDSQDRADYESVLRARRTYEEARQQAVGAAQRLGGDAKTQPQRVVIQRRLEPYFEAYSQLLQQEADDNHKNSLGSADTTAHSVQVSQQAIATALVLSVILACICGLLLVRLANDLTGIIGQVRKATIQVNTSVTEIAATSREQQATSSEIAATTTEVGATSKEISATSKELVKSMNEVSGVAERTAELAASGQSGLARMESTMHQIMDASGSINDRLTVLNEKAGNINTVVTTIAKVADQTNLLSLNAAIEAEKAGEYGRGFAVVAGEIRRLADQTAVATLDIEQMVKEMQSAVSAGVMGLDKFSEAVRRGVEVVGTVGQQLTEIIQQVRLLTPNFEAVNEGMQSQSLGAQQISDALSQLSEAAQQTVESLRQSNMAIEQLNDTVRGLQSSVSRFTVA